MIQFVDTNVFLCAIGRDHDLKLPSTAILEKFEQGQIELTTNTEVIQEVLYVLSRRGDRPVAVEVARDLLDLFVDCCPLRGRIF